MQIPRNHQNHRLWDLCLDTRRRTRSQGGAPPAVVGLGSSVLLCAASPPPGPPLLPPFYRCVQVPAAWCLFAHLLLLLLESPTASLPR